MIKVTCIRCKCELRELGGLVLSPPDFTGIDCEKNHVCVKCYGDLIKWILLPGRKACTYHKKMKMGHCVGCFDCKTGG